MERNWRKRDESGESREEGDGVERDGERKRVESGETILCAIFYVVVSSPRRA